MGHRTGTMALGLLVCSGTPKKPLAGFPLTSGGAGAVAPTVKEGALAMLEPSLTVWLLPRFACGQLHGRPSLLTESIAVRRFSGIA
jgi:hypothetical protein